MRCIKDLVKLEQDWIPNSQKCSLYIRPTLISTEVLFRSISHLIWLACNCFAVLNVREQNGVNSGLPSNDRVFNNALLQMQCLHYILYILLKSGCEDMLQVKASSNFLKRGQAGKRVSQVRGSIIWNKLPDQYKRAKMIMNSK